MSKLIARKKAKGSGHEKTPNQSLGGIMSDQTEGGTVVEEQVEEFQVPAGFAYKADTTKVGENSVAVEYLQADSTESWKGYFASQEIDFDAYVLKTLNAAQKAGATGNRNALNKAIEGGNESDIAEATEEFQKNCREYILGELRSRTRGPVTQQQAKDFGNKVISLMASGNFSMDAVNAAALELGIDPAKIGELLGAK